ncbi:MAG TPA: imidazole glycerol phosphate synthase subunit HisH [Puia sp.]|nr:imidazole glycerol phosphate synthase subunit HisH [Puia sp.]
MGFSDNTGVVIIQYNAGNIQSVLYALERIGIQAVVTDNPEEIRKASRVIFPGVGEASSAMKYLKERKLDELIISLQQPVLGICLGMQLLCKYSEENNTQCLGIFDEEPRHFDLIQRSPGEDLNFKIPQIGWNNIYDLESDLFLGIPENSYCYFVHSYFADLGQHTIARTKYGKQYSSALQKNNFYGVQFHPEKSAAVGERILRNFIEI